MLLPYRPPRGAIPDAADWARHKETIAYLYLEENKTLREVDEIMRAKHNFRATVKMYKSRFKQWHFRKKLSVEEGVKFEAQVVAGNTPNLPAVRGRQLGSQRLKARIADLRSDQAAATKTAKHQGPMVLSKRIDPPEQLWMADLALRTIATYSECRLGDWATKDNLGGQNKTSRWVDKMFFAFTRVVDDTDVASSFRFFNKSCDSVRSTLKLQEPELLWGTLLTVMRLSTFDRRLASSFARLVLGFCSIDFGLSHPLTMFLTCVLRTDMSVTGIGCVVIPVLYMQLDFLEKHIGPGNLLVPRQMGTIARHLAQMKLITIDEAQSRLERAIQLTNHCIAFNPDIPVTKIKSSIFSLYIWRICAYADTGNLPKAMEASAWAENWLEKNPETDPISRVNLTELKAHFSDRAGDYVAAEKYFKQALSVARDFVKQDPPVRLGYSIAEMVDFHIRRGNLEAAEKVRVEYEAHLKLLAGETLQEVIVEEN